MSDSKPRVLFLISVMGHGRGGHFYSLRTTAEALSASFPCHIVMLGRQESPVIAGSAVPHSLVRMTGWNVLSALSSIRQAIRDFRPTVLHSFDVPSHALARIAGTLAGVPVVMTKAGGPNPRRHFPFADDIVCFSVENHRFFSAHPKFRRARLHHIPNRAVEIEDDPMRIARIRAMMDPDKPVLMRIARFNPHYRESILQAVSLANRLNGDGVPCQLVLIGTPQIPAVYEEILALRNDSIHVLAQDEFTVDASKVLGIADVVISTGRSVMEAAGKGKVLLTPIAGGSIPVLISEDNFLGFFETNFSPRNSLEGYDEEANYRAIKEIFADSARTSAMKALSRSWFQDHFDIHRALDRYEDMYRVAGTGAPSGHHPLDALLGLGLAMRNFIQSGG